MKAETDCKAAIATRSSNKATARLGFFCQNLFKELSLHTLPDHVYRVSKKPRSVLTLEATKQALTPVSENESVKVRILE